MASPKRLITIAIPAFNEEERLVPAVETVARCAAEAPEQPLGALIVDDGSSDRTWEIARSLEGRFPFVRAIRNETNRGVGATLLRAAAEARGEKILLFPADNCVSAGTLRDLVMNAWKADFVGSSVENFGERRALRRALSRIYSWLYRAAFGLPMSHVHA